MLVRIAGPQLINNGQCKVNGPWAHTGVNFGALDAAGCLAAISQESSCNQKMFIVNAGSGCYCFSDLNADESSCSEFASTGYKTYTVPTGAPKMRGVRLMLSMATSPIVLLHPSMLPALTRTIVLHPSMRPHCGFFHLGAHNWFSYPPVSSLTRAVTCCPMRRELGDEIRAVLQW